MTSTQRPLSAARRAQKLASARRRLEEAQALLDEVCDDFAARAWELPEAEKAPWSTIARATTQVEHALDTLPR